MSSPSRIVTIMDGDEREDLRMKISSGAPAPLAPSRGGWFGGHMARMRRKIRDYKGACLESEKLFDQATLLQSHTNEQMRANITAKAAESDELIAILSSDDPGCEQE